MGTKANINGVRKPRCVHEMLGFSLTGTSSRWGAFGDRSVSKLDGSEGEGYDG